MKQYESIPYYGHHLNADVIAFDKLDGSNVRFEFSKKRGFYKYGTRRQMIDESNEQFGFVIDLFNKKYADGLTTVMNSKSYRNVLSMVCFGELVGYKSAFGQHYFKDDIFDIVLFDVSLYKKGFIPPKQLIDDFGHLGIPRVIYEGKLNNEFIADVKANKFDLREGVVAKGKVPVGKKGKEQIFSCKVKTNDWFDRLRNKDPLMYDLEMQETLQII